MIAQTEGKTGFTYSSVSGVSLRLLQNDVIGEKAQNVHAYQEWHFGIIHVMCVDVKAVDTDELTML